jgi:hypothetical protein
MFDSGGTRYPSGRRRVKGYSEGEMSARDAVKRLLPDSLVAWIARRRALRRYLRAVSYEMLERESRLEDVEGRAAARVEGFEERTIRAVMARNDVILEELARRVEAQEARHARRVHELEREIAELRGRGGEAPAPRLLSEAD